MPQMSKFLKSYETWKEKASERAELLREARKRDKRHNKQISELKRRIKHLEQSIEVGKKN